MKYAIASALLVFAPTARADLLDSSETLRVLFTIDNNWTGPAPDALMLRFGVVQILSGVGTRTAALYDGNTLLGIDTATAGIGHGSIGLSPANSFASPSSPWTFEDPAIVDFGAILGGTISGRIDFTIAQGAVDIPLGQVELTLIRATSGSGGNLVFPAPTLLSVDIVGNVSTSYCNTQPNSSGVPALLEASGSLSVQDQLLNLTVTGCPGSVWGMFLLGTTQTFVPYGDGVRCIGFPVQRILPTTAVNSMGVALHPLDFNAPYTASIQPGATVNFQYWFVDPAALMSGFNLTNGIELAFVP